MTKPTLRDAYDNPEATTIKWSTPEPVLPSSLQTFANSADIKFVCHGKEVLKINDWGFWVEGRPVQIEDLEEHDRTVYKTFKAFLRAYGMLTAAEEPK